MEPGDALIFDSYTVHGSSGNLSQATRRRAYATRWATDEVLFDARPGTMHYTWKEKGFDAKLGDGKHVGGELHPRVDTIMRA